MVVRRDFINHSPCTLVNTRKGESRIDRSKHRRRRVPSDSFLIPTNQRIAVAVRRAFRLAVSPVRWDGQPQWECVTFDPSPASFSKIWFVPNHVRAWRAEFYRRIGGHDPSRAVLDDQDILCRTFIHGRVKHIDRCLYVYHVHASNTCRGEENGLIQTETLAMHDQYNSQLVERWCDQNGLRKIDLCGGINSAPGYESVDLHGGRIAAEVNARWPFGDGEVGVFRAHDVLEHLRDPIHTMKELQRSLAVQGWLLSQTPSTDGRSAFHDPTHVSFWNSNSFWYYTRADHNRFIECPVQFQANRLMNFFPSEWHREYQIVSVKADLMKVARRVPGGVANCGNHATQLDCSAHF